MLTKVAASGLSTLASETDARRTAMMALGVQFTAPTTPALFTICNEDEHQVAIWKALIYSGHRVLREIGFPAWSGEVDASVDFLYAPNLHQQPPDTDMIPIQYKAQWCSALAMARDLLVLGMWWAQPPPAERAVWYCSQNAADGQAVVNKFARDVSNSIAAPGNPGDWEHYIATWRPTAALVCSEPITQHGTHIAYLHCIKISGFTGPLPINQHPNPKIKNFDPNRLRGDYREQ
jgi:hypothetical protein